MYGNGNYPMGAGNQGHQATSTSGGGGPPAQNQQSSQQATDQSSSLQALLAQLGSINQQSQPVAHTTPTNQTGVTTATGERDSSSVENQP